MIKQKKEQIKQNHHPELYDPERCASPPVITVDYDLYAHYLEGSELSDAQKQELLQTLWNIVCEFVSLGFNVHPVQQAKKTCGQVTENRGEAAPTSAIEVSSLNQFITENLADYTDPETERSGEGVEA